MAQRYGRNRKRANLAKIAELTAAQEREAGLAKYLGCELRRLRQELEDWDDEITRLLGAYSSFRRTTPVVETTHPLREVPIRPRIRDAYVRMDKAGEFVSMESFESFTRERMLRFIVMCESDDVGFRRIIRLVEHDSRTDAYAYSISEAMLRSGLGERDIEYLAREIARQFTTAFNQRLTDRQFVRS